MWAMSDEKPPAEICKGVNGFDKAVLREDNRRSAEWYEICGRRKPNLWQNLETVNKPFAMWRLRLLKGTSLLKFGKEIERNVGAICCFFFMGVAPVVGTWKPYRFKL